MSPESEKLSCIPSASPSTRRTKEDAVKRKLTFGNPRLNPTEPKADTNSKMIENRLNHGWFGSMIFLLSIIATRKIPQTSHQISSWQTIHCVGKRVQRNQVNRRYPWRAVGVNANQDIVLRVREVRARPNSPRYLQKALQKCQANVLHILSWTFRLQAGTSARNRTTHTFVARMHIATCKKSSSQVPRLDQRYSYEPDRPRDA